MQLLLAGAGTRLTCDWGSFALLRDNIQHYLEDGEPSSRFRALHALDNVVESGPTKVDAARLRGEVLRAWCALWRVDVQSAAISLRTRAVLTGCPGLPQTRDTVAARTTGWELPLAAEDLTPVPQAAGDFVSVVLALTEHAVDGDTLQVRSLETRPARGRRPRTEHARSAGVS